MVIFQENRTPDNLFQGLCIPPYGSPSSCNSMSPTASQYDIASTGTDSTDATIALRPIDLGTVGPNPDNYDLSHVHRAFVDMCDLNPATGVCAMDGANLIPYSCTAGSAGCPPPPDPQFRYVIPTDVQPYLTMAQSYTFADHMFQTNQGPSFPAHQFIIAGTSAPTATSNLFAAENPLPDGTPNAGCIADPGVTVALVDLSGSESQSSYPCYEHPTLTDLLDAKGISWRYYARSAGSIWTGPDAIQHMCQPQTQNGQLVCTGSIWNNVIVPPQASRNQKQVLTDIASNQLAQVTWVIPRALSSDHSSESDGSGPSG